MKIKILPFSFKRGLLYDSTMNRNMPVAEDDQVGRMSETNEPRSGRDHLQVAFDCTGGQHRSVYFAERMAERLAGIDGVEIEVSHVAKSF